MKYFKWIVGIACILGSSLMYKLLFTEITVIEGIRYKISVNGSSANAFPTNDTTHAYTVSVSCDNSEAIWDYANWKLKIKNTSAGTDKCSIAFNDVTSNDYINNYLNTNKGTTQGTTSAKGKLVNEKGVRYEGTDPYNYVSFNGELWRIIGMFAFNKSTNVEVNGGSTDCTTYNCYTKIIRNDSIGSYAFSALGTSQSTVYNYWEKIDGTKATLNTLLNTYYYNHTDGTSNSVCRFYGNTVTANCDFTKRGIQESYKPMVQQVVWNLGGYSSATNTQAMYGYERGSTRPSNNINALTASGYIGLMYPSDYGYSVQSSNCSRTRVSLSAYGTAACGGKAWLLKNGYEWTITPRSSSASGVFILSSYVTVYSNDAYEDFPVRPVLYLTSKTYIVSGSGKIDDPYVLGLDTRS